MISIRFFHLTKITAYTLLIGIIPYSCNSGSKKNGTAKNQDSVNTQVPIKPTVSANRNQHILTSNITAHFFSNHSQKDTFKLILRGDSLYTATAIFSIVSYTGERIYADTFHGYDLYSIEDTLKGKVEIENHIKDRVQTFFGNSAFITPAVEQNEGIDSDYSNPELWKELASDVTAIGFQYFIGDEDNMDIAYSKKQHKVLVYWSCC